jgi:NADPH2:quinone reductase
MMAESSAQVRAARLHHHDQPLKVEAVALGDPGPDELRVELQFGGVNPVDRYVAEGRVAPEGPRPRTLGAEAAGVLDGQPVLVAGEGLGAARDGVWSEAAVVPRAAVHELPEGVSPEAAAAMGIAGLTAFNVVRELAQVRAEDRVLVLGASGGVGSIIVSLARAAGATVWGQTGSAAKADGIKAQGAERVIVTGPDELAGALGDFVPTVVFDPLGGGFVGPVVEATEARGRIVSFGTSAGAQVTFNLQSLYRKSLRLMGYGGMQLGREQRRAGLKEALAALAGKEMRVPIDAVLPLDEVNEALARFGQRGVQGNLLLDLR